MKYFFWIDIKRRKMSERNSMKKILFCKWNIVGEDDVEEALKQQGFLVQTIQRKIESVDYDQEYLNYVAEHILSIQPDYVFSLNFIPIVARVCQVVKRPYVSVSVDCPEIMLYSETIQSEWNRIFLFDQAMCQQFLPYNKEHIYYLPLGTNVNHWDQVCKEERPKFNHEVSFVGSLYTQLCKYEDFQFENEYLKGYVDALIEAQLQVYGYHFMGDLLSDEQIASLRKSAGYLDLGQDYRQDDREIIVGDYLSLKCSMEERLRMLNAVANIAPLHLYTTSDANAVAKAIFEGTVDYKTEMAKVFHQSKINLNITSKGIQSGIPLRIFDVLGCGGFLITNYQSDMEGLFEIGKDFVVYENQQDLLEKVSFYLKHPEERMEIATHGYEKVKNYFTWNHMVQRIFEIV